MSGHRTTQETPITKFLRATFALRGSRTARLREEAKAEHDALLSVEHSLRQIHGNPVVGARMGCETCNALVRLDEVRGG